MKVDFLGDEQITFLKQGKYIEEGETIEDRFTQIVDRVREYEEDYSEGLADRLSYMISKNILSLSTPALSNFGRIKKAGSNTQALPVSCNIVSYGDSIASIYHSHGETAMLSKLGAGVGQNYINISDGGTEIAEGFFTNSKLDWIEDGLRTAQKVSQSNKRRGYATPFVSILDSEFDKIMQRVDKNNPDKRDPLATNTVGIILPKGFRGDMLKDKDYQRRWLKVLKARDEDGRVYMLDVDNCNVNQSPVYKELGLEVNSTNICTEFLQPTFEDKTSACVLSSLNLVHWDEIKNNPQMIKDSFMFLDILNEEYIKLTEGVPFMGKANKAAREKRDIGLGTLGFHEMLQERGMAFGDIYSRKLNKEVYSTIRECGEEATLEMAIKLGSPKLCREAGMTRRNASLMMIAPNKSTSFISGATSLGIEPFFSNIFMKAIANIQHVSKNKHLKALLQEKGKDTPEVWEGIMDNLGSVQKLDFLSRHEKDVFKTFPEISPKDIIDLASDRQEFIDMGQSLNLIIRPNYGLKDLHDMHTYAFEKGIKTLYYAYPQAHAALEQSGDDWDDCLSCAD